MRVIDYFNQADHDDLVVVYNGVNNDQIDPNVYRSFIAYINLKVPHAPDDGMRVILTHVTTEWSKYEGCGDDDDDYIDVAGIDQNDKVWSLSFVPWAEWLAMEVIDDTGKNLDVVQIAAEVYREMTWHGSEDDATKRFTKLKSLAKEVENEIRSETRD